MKQITEFKRILKIDIPINPLKGSGAAFLWGPRGTGKTTYLKQKYPAAKYYDLLKSDLFTELTLHPSRLHEEILAQKPKKVIIDEIQKVPRLMDEIHWLLENTSTGIILCGSSARKLKREAKNLLGGRAVSFHLFPLAFPEIENFDLNKALSFGTLPRHYIDQEPQRLLKAYVNDYLKEEIIEEAVTRNIPSFARFLEVVALTHGQLLNYANVGRETGVSPSTVRDYYRILEETLLGHTLEPWKKNRDRRLIETAKFYLFDPGIANYLNPEIKQVVEGTDIYGNAFEHFLLEEVRAYLSYQERDDPVSFWRTASGYEVDLIVGQMEVCLEFKSAQSIGNNHLKGMRALKEEHHPKKAILVCREKTARRTTDGIDILPWKTFLEQLWAGEMI